MQHKSILFIILCALAISGCRKTLDVDATNLVPEARMWQQRSDARSAVMGAYALLRSALANENAYLAYGELRTGDFRPVSRQELLAVQTQNLSAGYATVESWKDWRRFYALIHQANLNIAKLPEVAKNDFRYRPEDLALDVANMRFLRALGYFYLARIWGDVPLATNPDPGNFETLPASKRADVLAYAFREAEAAAKGLPWRYDGKWPEQQGNYWEQNDGRWRSIIGTKGACYALLAHISALTNDYASTEQYAKLVIDNSGNGGYAMATTGELTSETGLFKGQGYSVIFAVSFLADNQESSITGHIEDWTLSEPFIPRKTAELYIPKDSILRIFDEAGDQRFSLNANGTAAGSYFTNFDNSMPMFSKIKARSYTQTPVIRNYQSAIVVFRLEELTLLRAEANLFINDLPAALGHLNRVRSQRGLPDFSTADGDMALEFILKERRRELLGEGWRWFDLARLQKIPAYTTLTESDVLAGAPYWPLSGNTLRNNPLLSQNKFWK